MNTYIGIDPSFRKSGFAACIIRDDVAEFKVFKGFLEFYKWVHMYKANDGELTYVSIENSNLQNVTFKHGKEDNSNKGIREKMSRDAGKNQAISQITVDICRVIFGEKYVHEISPEEKGAKIENLKIFDAIIRSDKVALVGYKGLVGEQDKRDAYIIACKAKTYANRCSLEKK
jgi:hypothetical protein